MLANKFRKYSRKYFVFTPIGVQPIPEDFDFDENITAIMNVDINALFDLKTKNTGWTNDKIMEFTQRIMKDFNFDM